MSEYYHNMLTDKSWRFLQELRRVYSFVLIGGWAVYLYTHQLKSKDIDCVIDYEVLEKLRAVFPCTKNERLKKYEIHIEEVDVDLYLPHYSNPGLPAEVVQRHTESREGFTVAKPEALLLLKQRAYEARASSPKGEKDKIDILAMLEHTTIAWATYHALAAAHERADAPAALKQLLEAAAACPELELNEHAMARLKKKILPLL